MIIAQENLGHSINYLPSVYILVWDVYPFFKTFCSYFVCHYLLLHLGAEILD